MRLLQNRALLAVLAISTTTVLVQGQDESGPWPESIRPDASDATSLKIIALHLKARGGEEAIKAVKGLKAEGQLFEGKLDYQVEALWRPSDSLIVKSTRQYLGDDYVSAIATNGENAWSQDMLPKRKNPVNPGGADRKALEIDTLLPFLFIDAAESGNLFSYRGKSTFAGAPVYVVHVWMKNGSQIEALFDQNTFQILNYRQAYKIGPKEVIIDRTPTGLMRAGDIWWDKGYAYRLGGKTFREMIFSKIILTPDPGSGIFQEPPSHERWLEIKR